MILLKTTKEGVLLSVNESLRENEIDSFTGTGRIALDSVAPSFLYVHRYNK